MFRSFRTLRSIPRIKDIALVLARHGMHQFAGYVQAPVTGRIRRFFSLRSDVHVIQEPERLRLVLQDLGPTFIKFGQLLSTRPDLLPRSYLRELEKLQDDVRPSRFEEIQRTVEADLGGPLAQFFEWFSPEPLASASIAQVHQARTLQGESVVVKVRKQGLERVIEQDLYVLRLLAGMLREWSIFRFQDLDGVLRLFETTIRRELDFENELLNVERMRQSFAGSGEIHIPAPYRSLSAARVLTLEYLPGQKLQSIDKDELGECEREGIALRITIALLRQIFEHGLYHADPHPGNFIRLPDGRVGLIDFGSVGKFTPEMMDDLALLLHHLLERDYRALARIVLRIGRPQKEVDARSLAFDLLDSLDQYQGHSVAEIHFGGLFRSLFEIALRYEILMPPPYVLLGRTLVTLEGVVRKLAPTIEMLSKVRPYLEKVLRDRWSPERLLRELRATGTDLLQQARSYPMQVGDLLQRASEGRLRLETRLQNTETIERRLQELGARIPQALLVCALLGSSSVLLFAAHGEAGLQLTLGIVGYVGALLLIVRMLMRF